MYVCKLTHGGTVRVCVVCNEYCVHIIISAVVTTTVENRLVTLGISCANNHPVMPAAPPSLSPGSVYP